MSKKLVIVESPHKSKTIEKYLGKDFKVVSSVGHIRDLSTSGKYGFGVDIDNNFKPDYKIIKGKAKLVKELKKDIKDADFVYLATDPDREGEAISWHLYDTLGLKEENYDRIVFNEITKKAVLDSFNKARKIDDNLVKSQETRRILDRIIGFRLSKLMQSKTGGKSAGRVQSVALKLIVDREREIEAFIPEEYFEIEAKFNDFDAKLDTYNHKKIEIKKESEAKEILSKLSNAFKIESIDKKEKAKKSKFPFTTSTLEQEASTKLGFTSKKTMMIAQKLYEGINLKDGAEGLISYMRTDSVRLSDEFIKDTFNDNLADIAELQTIPEKDIHGNSGDVLRTDHYDRVFENAAGNRELTIQMRWKEKNMLSYLVLKEAIPYSQRVEKFSVWYAAAEGKKEKLTEATTIGYKKIVDLQGIETDLLEIRIEDARVAPVLSFVGVYK